MHSCALGRTGINVSTIGFGASPLGGVFGEVGVEQGRAAVRHAIDRGINLFDVSPYYGLTLAEERLGAALEGRRHEVVLASKCGRYGVDRFDFSAATVIAEFESTLRRLKTDYVDLLQVHDVEFGSVEQIVNETVPALRSLQAQGKVRMVGVTGYWPALLARVIEAVEVDTVLNYCHFNLMMDDMDRTLTPVAVEQGIGLLNASPLHMGLLGGAPAPSWHPAPAAVQAAASAVVALSRSYGIRPATLAVYACLQHKAAAATLVGFGSTEQVDDALAALTLVPPEECLEAVRRAVAPVFNTVWASGLAENQPGVAVETVAAAQASAAR